MTTISRFDLRKNYEEAEANATGTEFVRAGLLPAADVALVRDHLRKCLALRIAFYRTRDARKASESQCRYRSASE